MPAASARRNVFVLTLCQALGMTAVVVMVTVSALTGDMLAEDRTFATLPLSLQYLSTMLATIPASLLMKHVGRRAGFSIGALFGIASGGLSVVAVVAGSFWLFCLGNALIGVAQGFGLFYRFAAAEAADDAFRSKAISLVLSGGVVAAVVGPELAKLSSELIEGARFAGCFAVIAWPSSPFCCCKSSASRARASRSGGPLAARLPRSPGSRRSSWRRSPAWSAMRS